MQYVSSNVKLGHSYADLPKPFYQEVLPEQFTNPSLLALNEELAKELGLNLSELEKSDWAKVFSGQLFLPGSKPIAQAYAGFQFAHPVEQLGDGRAHLLGELAGKDIQLKGAGRTRFSRRGDGRSALGPVIREFLVSEAMYHLGVPTTRALAAVRTNEEVFRQFGPEPGGIFTRVADSHIRVGSFQYFWFKKDFDSIATLMSYTIHKHYRELEGVKDQKEQALRLLESFAERQSKLVAQWTALGFIHGVMNTDNFSLAGITIDYGPCAFMDHFEYEKTFSSIDHAGRYSYWNQLPIAQWNIVRLADCLLPLIDTEFEKASKLIETRLGPVLQKFEKDRWRALAKKFGITDFMTDDIQIIKSFLDYLQIEKLDFTQSFRNLPQLFAGDKSQYVESEELDQFLKLWKQRSPNISDLDNINPLYIPRNHLIQKAIEDSYKGNDESFFKLFELFKNPYSTQNVPARFCAPPKEHEVVTETFCGT